MNSEDKKSSSLLSKKSSKTPPFAVAKPPINPPPSAEANNGHSAPPPPGPQTETQPKISDEKLAEEEKDVKSAENNFVPMIFPVATDLRIIDFYKSKTQFKREGIFENEKKAIMDALARPYEHITDRYRRFLRYLLPDEVDLIKTIANDDYQHYYIHFEPTPNMVDTDRKTFKDVSRMIPDEYKIAKPSKKGNEKKEQNAKLLQERKKKTRRKKNPENIFFKRPEDLRDWAIPLKKIKENDDLESNTQPVLVMSDKRKENAAATGMNIENVGTQPSLQNGVSAEAQMKLENDYCYEREVPSEYQTSDLLGLKRIKMDPQVLETIKEMDKKLKEMCTSLQVTYENSNYYFKIINDPVPMLKELFDYISKKMNLKSEEVWAMYEGVSLDLDDLRSYLDGKKELLWSKLEDEMLIRAVNDPQILPLIVQIKGQSIVNKRINFLKNMKKIPPKQQ